MAQENSCWDGQWLADGLLHGMFVGLANGEQWQDFLFDQDPIMVLPPLPAPGSSSRGLCTIPAAFPDPKPRAPQ